MAKLREDHAAELRDLETRKEAEFEKERAENQAIIEKLQKTIEEGSGKDHTIQHLKEEHKKKEEELRTLFRVELRKEKKRDKEDTDMVVNLFKKESGELTRKNQQLQTTIEQMQNGYIKQQEESKSEREIEFLKMKNEDKVSSLRKEVKKLQRAI